MDMVAFFLSAGGLANNERDSAGHAAVELF